MQHPQEKHDKRVASSPRPNLQRDGGSGSPRPLHKLDSDDILEMSSHRMPKNLRDKKIASKLLDIEHVMEYEGNVRGADLVIEDN